MSPSSSPGLLSADYCADLPMPRECLLWGIPWPLLVLCGIFWSLGLVSSLLFDLTYGIFRRMYFQFILKKKKGTAARKLRAERWEYARQKLRLSSSYLVRLLLAWLGFLCLRESKTTRTDAGIAMAYDVISVIIYLILLPTLLYWIGCLFSVLVYVTKEAALEGTVPAKDDRTPEQEADFRQKQMVALAYEEGLYIAQYISFLLVLLLVLFLLGGNVSSYLQETTVIGVLLVLAIHPWLKNLASGIMIFQDRRYVFGQIIQVPGSAAKGVVEEIRLSTTAVRFLDGSLCYIPNVLLSERAFVNFKKEYQRSIVIKARLRHDAPASDVRSALSQLEHRLRDARFLDVNSELSAPELFAAKLSPLPSIELSFVGLEAPGRLCVRARTLGLTMQHHHAVASEMRIAVIGCLEECDVRFYNNDGNNLDESFDSRL